MQAGLAICVGQVNLKGEQFVVSFWLDRKSSSFSSLSSATHPGKSDAAERARKEVAQERRVRLGRGKVGVEPGRVPVSHLSGVAGRLSGGCKCPVGSGWVQIA